jgi:hypothetical protein
MVMIDLGHEKKSLGVISVTRVTESSRRRHPAKPRLVKAALVGRYETDIGAGASRPCAGKEK